jgi:hypothetical protein
MWWRLPIALNGNRISLRPAFPAKEAFLMVLGPKEFALWQWPEFVIALPLTRKICVHSDFKPCSAPPKTGYG